MRLRYWGTAVIIIAVIFAVEYDLARRNEQQLIAKNRKPAQASSLAALEKPVGEAVSANQVKAKAPATFEEHFKFETQAMAQLQANPLEVEQRLEALALSLTPQNIQSLSQIMQDTSQNGDDRAMAVELLSRRKTPEALQALENFVQNHESTTQKNWSRSQEFESVIRAQAVEGIAAYPQKERALTSLNALSQKVDESFLLDRIVRSSESVKGKAAATEHDEAALKKLLE